MSEKEYAKNIIDILPEEKIGEVVEYLLNISEGEDEEIRFNLVSEHILEKYRKAFEELAK